MRCGHTYILHNIADTLSENSRAKLKQTTLTGVPCVVEAGGDRPLVPPPGPVANLVLPEVFTGNDATRKREGELKQDDVFNKFGKTTMGKKEPPPHTPPTPTAKNKKTTG